MVSVWASQGRVKAALVLVALIGSISVQAHEPIWDASSPVPKTGRPNPFELSEPEWGRAIERGRLHAQIYPVSVTAMLIPERPLKEFIEGTWVHPLRAFFQALFRIATGYTQVDEIWEWLGLHHYPSPEDEGVYSVPYPNGTRPTYRMGQGLISRYGVQGLSFSCAACHSAELFGKTVLGMTNRFPRSNEFVAQGRRGSSLVSPELFQFATDATDEERRMYEDLRRASRAAAEISPSQLGLDTSLAHTAISLAHRADDDWATLTEENAEHPRADFLEHFVADSKPAVWWNVKYKNRFLSDGSVISGNPIYTNLLWNEIGRGTDLKALDGWLSTHPEVIRDLAAAVFASEAPRFTDFFPPERLPLEQARRGQETFERRCAHCHGHYEKAWDAPEAELLPLIDQLKTTRVLYHELTPVMDVGTDPQRAQGMVSLERSLNRLELSKRHDIRIEVQTGYVPPPLVGIWARWPYFHNNSAPTLCAVLSLSEERPRKYLAVPAQDPSTDFDSECNGYPVPTKVRQEYRTERFEFDTLRPGLRNTGHEHRFSARERRDLIVFLQTL